MRFGKMFQFAVGYLLLAVLVAGCGSRRAPPTSTMIPASTTPSPSRTLAPTLSPTIPLTATPTRILIPPPLPPPLQAAGLGGVTVNTLCVIVKQDFRGDKLSEPIVETTQHILAPLSIHVPLDGDTCEATLHLDLSFDVERALYTGGYCYNGVEMTGRMDLVISGRTAYTKPLSYSRVSPRTIVPSDCRKSPNDAPFDRAWSKVLLDGLTDLWGSVILISSLNVSTPLTIQSATMLGDLGPQAKIAVPALIDCLSTTVNNYYCSKALVAIAGQDFEYRQDRWWQWWDEQRP